MAVKYPIKIGTSASSSGMIALPTPDEMTVSLQTLDSQKSGRNNNTGKMFRDKVAEKLTIKLKMPYGLSNSQIATILSIVKADSFYCTVLDPRTGTYKSGSNSLNVYCASAEPQIAKITSFSETQGSIGDPTAWVYEAFDLTFVEM